MGSCRAGQEAGNTVERDDGKTGSHVLYVLALVAVVVCVDVLFLRHQLWLRLITNIGIVLVFGAFYLRFLKGPLVRQG